MIESILRAYGLRTGLLTSPHLVRVNERIVIDGRPISNRGFAENWDDIRPYLALVDAELVAAGDEPLTFFEALTLLAFACFADAPVDVAVLEVGMGGEWDSTNVADGQVAVFGPIALDHVQRLGSTIAQIARTKSGIIKPLAAVVSAEQVPEAVAELEHAVELSEATLVWNRTRSAWRARAWRWAGSWSASGGSPVPTTTSSCRCTETIRATTPPSRSRQSSRSSAVGRSRLTRMCCSRDSAASTSPGRLQLVGIEPTVLVDAAHNPHGAHALAEALRTYFDFSEITFVVGVLEDKDAAGILSELAELATRFEVTQSGSDRAIPASDLAPLVARYGETHEHADLVEALGAAREWAMDGPNRAVVVTGSITLVGETIAIASRQGWKQ